MKATGIVKRVDDLGRIAIPKTIRTIMGIKQDTALEFYTEGNDIILRQYVATPQSVKAKVADLLIAVDSLCKTDAVQQILDTTKTLAELVKEL